MAEGWRERVARLDDFDTFTRLYRHPDGRIEYVDEPPKAMNIPVDLANIWNPSDEGLVSVPTLAGPLKYEIIGQDALRDTWVAIRVSSD